MEYEFRKTAGICFCLGSILAIATMILHPSGGSISTIVKIKSVLIFSHAIALFCLPFIGFGSWGLSQLLSTKNKLTTLAFFIFCTGLIAAMIAGTLNGLVLPHFAVSVSKKHIEDEIVKSIVSYGFVINAAMTSIFVFATALSISIWSITIILTKLLPKWLGYYGLLLVALGTLGFVLSFDFTDLFGFRLFIFGLVSWLILAGIKMLTIKK